jgi:hypothetical protein
MVMRLAVVVCGCSKLRLPEGQNFFVKFRNDLEEEFDFWTKLELNGI